MGYKGKQPPKPGFANIVDFLSGTKKKASSGVGYANASGALSDSEKRRRRKKRLGI